MGVEQSQVAGVPVAAVLLGLDVVLVQLVHRGVEATKPAGAVLVDVALGGAVAQVADLVHAGAQEEAQAEAGQVGEHVAALAHVSGDVDAALAVHGVGDLDLGDAPAGDRGERQAGAQAGDAVLHRGIQRVDLDGHAVVAHAVEILGDEHVVVQRGAPDVPLGGGSEHALVIAGELGGSRGALVEAVGKVRAAHGDVGVGLLEGEAAGDGRKRRDARVADGDLVKAQLVALRKASGVAAGGVEQADLHQVALGQLVGQLDPGFAACGDGGQRQRLAPLIDAVEHGDALDAGKLVGALEGLLVAQQHGVLLRVVGDGAQGADDVLVLLQAGVGRAVGVDQAVHAEVAVVGLFAEVAAVVVDVLAGDGLAHVDGVVAPLPDEAAAEVVVFVDELLVVLGVSGAVAHRVDVFAQDEGLLVVLILAVLLAQAGIQVHAAVQVDHGDVHVLAAGVDGALVVQQAGGVVGLDPAAGLDEAHTVARLVAHGPDEHAGAVLVADDAALDAVEHRLFEHGVVGQQRELILAVRAVGRDHAVHLDVGLVDDVEAQLVAQLVEAGGVGVVAGADGVDVVLLHQRQVAQHLVEGDGKAVDGRGIVAVRAAELDLRAVELDDLVFDGDGAQADAGGDLLLVGQQRQLVEVGGLGVPQVRVGDVDCDGVVFRDAGGDGRALIGEHITHVGLAGHVQRNADAGVAAGDVGDDGEVAHVVFGALEQVDVAEDAAHAQLVLILGIGAAGPLEHQHVDAVVAVEEVLCDVELAGGVRHAGKAHVGAVDPDEVGGVHALKVQVIGAALALAQREVALVHGAGVVVGHKGRVVGDGVAHVGVLVGVVPIGLPDGGHRHALHLHLALPARLERRRVFKPAEVPFAREHCDAVGIQAMAHVGWLVGKVGDVAGAVFLHALVQQVGVFQISLVIHTLTSMIA